MGTRNRIIGACVFRNDGNGILSSQFVNENSPPFTETCQRIGGANASQPFVGRYNSVWLEDLVDREVQINPRRAILDIEFNISQNSYRITWTAAEGLHYSGIGMLYSGLLVCGYWSRPR
jgi:hypothetical protein